MKTFSWNGVNTGGLQGSIDPLLFLININDSPGCLSSNVQHFTDYISLFSVVDDIYNPGSNFDVYLKL